MGDAAGYEDALTGEGVSLAVKQARAAVDAIVDDATGVVRGARGTALPAITGCSPARLVLASTPRPTRRAIVPACTLLPAAFRFGVNILAS